MDFFNAAQTLYTKAKNGQIGEAELQEIIEWPHDEILSLFAIADKLRREFHGERVDPCTLMNIKSGNCSEDCAFCSQSAHNSAQVNVTPLAKSEEIQARLQEASSRDLPFCVVSSGRGLSHSDIEMISTALGECKGEKHASLGIVTDEEFALLRKAGVSCYNHNLESSRNFFPKIVSTHTYDERINTVKAAKKAGLKVCCGGIFGLGETWQDRKEFCIELRNLGVDTVPINFLNAIPGTRVEKPKETPMDFLKIVAMYRIAMPRTTIKVCGGREVNLGNLQNMIFYAGANGYVTDGYLTTGGAGFDHDEKMIGALGLKKRLQE